ncbi:MAG: sulfatase-like hydrolase/transferase, partial [Verrucomicrobiota bacterium]|nr:sulfatase-like hydrolase/transferase [Verrucomicrobiota bacterium]
LNAFVTTPLCSPSRAGFLTGQYAHRTGIVDNTARDKRSHELVTFPRVLHEAGYETAFVGKWHMGTDDSPRPGFDVWVSVKGQGEYHDPELNLNGRRHQAKGYVTDIFTEHAVEFLKRSHSKPFCLFLAHKAVHPDAKQNPDGSLADPIAAVRNFIPAERHKHLYAKETPPRRPNYGPPENKPALMRKIGNLPPLSRETGTDDETIRNRLRMLAAVDEGMQQILQVLEQTKQLDNTLLVFTSDEGYFYGEHGLSVERRLAYEESIRIPLLIRYPKLIKPGSTVKEPVLNIDLAPTILEIAGAKIPGDVQGRSFLPLLQGRRVPWRDSFLIEYFSDTVFPRVHKMGYKALRTDRWKYINYLEIENAEELYDLQSDPYERKNLVGHAPAQGDLERLRAELARVSKGSD